MKLYTRTLLLLALATLSSGEAQAQAEIIGGPPLLNFSFAKIPMPKSNFTKANCNNGEGVVLRLPSGDYNTLQLTWDADEGDFGNVQAVGIDLILWNAIVCWIGGPFTVYIGTGNQTYAKTAK